LPGKPSDLLERKSDTGGFEKSMIETQQSVLIDAAIERVWDYVRDIRRWANVFPGCRECTVIDERDSRWTLKVGAGGLVKTVNVLVHVDHWDGPGRVDFSYELESDPVKGSGSYIAEKAGDQVTDVTLQVRVEGSGSMAPMWEAISKPLLPRLARSFAEQLKAEIEKKAREPACESEITNQ
jgi:carbon monoxide dehydrogenase subunit G